MPKAIASARKGMVTAAHTSIQSTICATTNFLHPAGGSGLRPSACCTIACTARRQSAATITLLEGKPIRFGLSKLCSWNDRAHSKHAHCRPIFYPVQAYLSCLKAAVDKSAQFCIDGRRTTLTNLGRSVTRSLRQVFRPQHHSAPLRLAPYSCSWFTPLCSCKLATSFPAALSSSQESKLKSVPK